jgi:hypothetical protein
MEYKDLKILADRFWEGECSELEENKLREYFRWNDTVPEEFLQVKNYLSLANEESSGLGIDFDLKILKAVEEKHSNITRSLNFKRFIPYAAAAMLAFGIFFFNPNSPVDSDDTLVQVEDTFDDPEKAFLEVKKALMMVSSKINKGKEYSNEIAKFSLATGQIQSKELKKD